MERAKPYLRAAAVVSAVALVGAFVAYRAGAFSSPPTEPQPEPAVTPEAASPAPQPGPSDDEKAKWIMYGSKSAPVLIPLPPTAAAGDAPQPQQPTLTPVTPAPNAAQPVFLGGSKSIIIHEPPKPPPPMPEPRKP